MATPLVEISVTEAKVHKIYVIAVKHDIFGLDIVVSHSRGVNLLQTVNQLDSNVYDEVCGNVSVGLYVVLQRLLVLGHDIVTHGYFLAMKKIL